MPEALEQCGWHHLATVTQKTNFFLGVPSANELGWVQVVKQPSPATKPPSIQGSDTSKGNVELVGIEPTASSMPWTRSAN